MKKYLPSRTEAALLFIGVMMGTFLTMYIKPWMTIVIVAPIFIVAESIIYIIEKRKNAFKDELAKAKDPEYLLKNTDK